MIDSNNKEGEKMEHIIHSIKDPNSTQALSDRHSLSSWAKLTQIEKLNSLNKKYSEYFEEYQNKINDLYDFIEDVINE